MSKPRTLIITTLFNNSLREIYFYIRESSLSNADKFVDGVYKEIPRIEKFPEANPIEHRLPTKRNLYRFKIYKKNYKIIFKVLNTKVILVGVIHASRNIDEYEKLRTKDYS